jgi:hypothetical protein
MSCSPLPPPPLPPYAHRRLPAHLPVLLLQPFVDHVPVAADLSDLEAQIRWCRANDDACRRIAANAKALAAHWLSRDGVLDYLQVSVRASARQPARPRAVTLPPSLPDATRPADTIHY